MTVFVTVTVRWGGVVACLSVTMSASGGGL